MRDRIKLFFSVFLFWIIFMIAGRILFLTYNYSLTADLTFSEILLVIWNGLKMDLSVTGYVTMFTGVLLTLSVWIPGRWIVYAIRSFSGFFIVFSVIIMTVDMELYKHWGFRMNTTPLFYMGSEAVGSADPLVSILLLIIMVLSFLGAWIFFNRMTKPLLEAIQPVPTPLSGGVLFLLSAVMFLPIRGSLSVAPMSISFVYFHKTKMYANHAGINVIWNFLYSLKSDANIIYPEDELDPATTRTTFSNMMSRSDSTTRVLTTTRPNVILIITESYTANVIESLGGKPGIAPNLTALSREGILFDHFYSGGDRTDKGLVSILSAYPAPPRRSIIMYDNKVQKLPHLSLSMQRLGYHTSFVYGGDADFANFRSYLSHGKFQHITTVDDFPEEQNTSKWGVHDEFLFDQAIAEADTASQPFFQTILTLSSHEPFDVPMKPIVPGDDSEAKFLNSCHYTDKCIGDFIAEAKTKPWWNNTLIIITADHGHRHPGNIDLKNPKRFYIPMLWLGGAVASDTVIHTMGGHTDIANTLLGQLDKPSDDFTFSKNLLDPAASDFAVYIFNNGYAYLRNDRYYVFDNTGKLFLVKEGALSEEDFTEGKAYMQTLYTDYNAKK